MLAGVILSIGTVKFGLVPGLVATTDSIFPVFESYSTQ